MEQNTPCELCNGDPRFATPYCWHWERREQLPSVSEAMQEPSRAALIAESEARMEAAYQAGASSVAQQVGAMAPTSAETPPAQPRGAKRRGPKKPSRRTSAQVQRAAEQEKREAEYRTRRASPEWLRDQLDVEADFVASLREEA